MKGKNTQSTSRTRPKGATDLKQLRALRDTDIDFADIPKLGKSFWKAARLVMPAPRTVLPSDRSRCRPMVEKKWPWLSDKDQRDFAFLHGGANRVNSPLIIYLFATASLRREIQLYASARKCALNPP